MRVKRAGRWQGLGLTHEEKKRQKMSSKENMGQIRREGKPTRCPEKKKNELNEIKKKKKEKGTETETGRAKEDEKLDAAGSAGQDRPGLGS